MIEVMVAFQTFVAIVQLAAIAACVVLTLGYREQIRALLKSQHRLVLQVKSVDAVVAQNVIQREDEREASTPDVEEPPKPVRVKVGSRRFSIFGLDPADEQAIAKENDDDA